MHNAAELDVIDRLYRSGRATDRAQSRYLRAVSHGLLRNVVLCAEEES